MNMNFKDKVVWITGASSGIGAALAYALAEKGSALVLSSTNKEKLEQVKAKCEAFHVRCSVVLLDLTKSAEFGSIVEQVIEEYGHIDILVNNGGKSQRSYAIETPIEIDRHIMEIDYFGHIALTKAVLPYMVKNGGGHILVTSSISGKFGFPLRSAYAAAKHALHGFYESLRAELFNQHIYVTIVCPGRVVTNISLNALEKDGTAHGVMDPGQSKGIDAETCARKILKAVQCNRKEIVIGGKEVIMVYIKKFIPALFYLLARKVNPV
jgi:dehydrogenase/reductase SDR family member 7B